MTNIKLVGSRITKIEADRKPEFSGNLEITTNIRVISIDKIKEAKDTLKISYAFEINYKELGKILIEGNIFISTDSKIIKEILKAKENKQLDSKEYITISNLINQRASIKALELEEELGLPIHMKLPTLTIKNQ